MAIFLPKPLSVILISIAGVLLIGLIILATIYFWPVRKNSLQTGVRNSVSYQQALRLYDDTVANEKQISVTSQCTSHLYTHNKRSAKTVVMFHGVTACPLQFEGLAKTFYDAGYNVYVPRAPHHGFIDKKQHSNVTAQELVDYVNQSVTLATGLGDEVGVVGLSGGGLLATWAAEYRSEVKRALVLSPFYEPAAAQAPKWQLPFLSVLYGYHLLPDRFSVPSTPDGAAFSYRALANYNIVTQNLLSTPTKLPLGSFSVITSEDDDQIDLTLAHSIPQKIANANPKMTFVDTTLPASWKLGHDIVSLQNKNVAARSTQLFELYLNTYEGRTSNL